MDKLDKAFTNPTKPVGPYYSTKKDAISHNPLGAKFVNIPNKGFRRVVPSPQPLSLLCMEGVKEAVKKHKIVVCGGGGGIPTIIEDKKYKLVDGVIDKDYVASLVADQIDADILVILTNVPNACINYGTQQERPIREVSVKQMKTYINDKQFSAGSMLPKVQAAIDFVSNGKNRKAIIARLEDVTDALKGKIGTVITK
ncbi:MAG: hypothetical protein MJ200_03040 [Mycoplasmoidaceae bacterium]|nr:hypothetical protein [Mycoplasmoidaceae bacterium]